MGPAPPVATYRPEFQPPPVATSGDGDCVQPARPLRRGDARALARRCLLFSAARCCRRDRRAHRLGAALCPGSNLTKAVVEADRPWRPCVDTCRAGVVARRACHLVRLAAGAPRPAAKNVAQAGAAIGRDFPDELLAAAAQLDELRRPSAASSKPAWSSAAAAPPPAAEYLFKHALVQETATPRRGGPRQALHCRIAEALEQRFPGNLVETRPEILAHQYGEAAIADKAITYPPSQANPRWPDQPSVRRPHNCAEASACWTGYTRLCDRKQLELDIHVTLTKR